MSGFSPEGYVSKAEQLENQINNKKPSAKAPLTYKKEWISVTGSILDQSILGGVIAYIVGVYLVQRYYVPLSLYFIALLLAPFPLILAYYVLPYLWVLNTSSFGAHRQILKTFYGGGLTPKGPNFKKFHISGGGKIVMYQDALEVVQAYQRVVIPYDAIDVMGVYKKALYIKTQSGDFIAFHPNEDALQVKNSINTMFKRLGVRTTPQETNSIFK